MKSTRWHGVVAAVAISVGAAGAMAQDSAKPDAAAAKPPTALAPQRAKTPTTAPATDAKLEADITPDAKKLISQVAEAYAKLKTLNLTGTMTLEKDVNGNKGQNATSFTSRFQAPNRFEHSTKDDIRVGSTGTRIYAFQPTDNTYVEYDAPKEKVGSDALPRPLPTVLSEQDPSLLLALCSDPAKELVGDAAHVKLAPDTSIDGRICPTLELKMKDGTSTRLAFDPETHLMRQSATNLTTAIQKQNPGVSSLVFKVNYSAVKPDAPVAAEQFAWVRPDGARDAAAIKSGGGPGEESNAADALVGHPAPSFKLAGLDGNEVSLASLKGKVVVLDLWATWCPPCRMSLPHLDKLYQSKKKDGLIVFAVDQQEEKDKVQAFVKETKLGVPVLLDSDGDMSEKYKVDGIPETIVIGKDGKVKKVFVGFNPDESPKTLKAVVEEAMKQ